MNMQEKQSLKAELMALSTQVQIATGLAKSAQAMSTTPGMGPSGPVTIPAMGHMGAAMDQQSKTLADISKFLNKLVDKL